MPVAVKTPAFYFLNLLLDVLAVGSHLLIPFPNWLPQEDQKSELRRTLSRRELWEIGNRVFRTREQSLEDGNQQAAPRKDWNSSDTGKRTGLGTEEMLWRLQGRGSSRHT